MAVGIQIFLSTLIGLMGSSCVNGDSGSIESHSCQSHYQIRATAATWQDLKSDLKARKIDGRVVERVRTVEKGFNVGVGDRLANRVIDLLNSRGERLVQGEVWETDRGASRAGVWSQCVD